MTAGCRLLQQIEQTVPGDEQGDLLVCLAGMEDIAAVAEARREHAARTRRWLVLPLHSALSVEEQDRVRPPSDTAILQPPVHDSGACRVHLHTQKLMGGECGR